MTLPKQVKINAMAKAFNDTLIGFDHTDLELSIAFCALMEIYFSEQPELLSRASTVLQELAECVDEVWPDMIESEGQ
jgi:hypothetical protein